jgi:hypothetical protein
VTPLYIDVDSSIPMSHYIYYLDSLFKSYEILKISIEVQACSWSLPM